MAVSTMNISLPDELKAFVDEQVGARGYTSSSEYVRELIRGDQDRDRLRTMLLEGASSPLSAVVADKAYFEGLRTRALRSAAAAPNGAAAQARKNARKSRRR
jgi:antitoxin ParD1/3/4